ncbi:hypothetical protein AVEN_107658-1 [Araneus ventricosus]|uniref:Uncharacterized protein n=1 Tax=Araneus ventricosus TaxID=182803 RepID=A0A4Y2Q5Q0_ARAVE|nr:hypothetical protein AVEN_107658-1 [Araneus ventricosus]
MRSVVLCMSNYGRFRSPQAKCRFRISPLHGAGAEESESPRKKKWSRRVLGSLHLRSCLRANRMCDGTSPALAETRDTSLPPPPGNRW